jgi:hypothetical protein
MINRYSIHRMFVLSALTSISLSAAPFASYIQWLNNGESLQVKSQMWLCGAVALQLLKDKSGNPYNPSDFKVVAEHWKNESYFIAKTGEYVLEADSFAARFNSATHRITLYQKQYPSSSGSTNANAGTGSQINISVGGSSETPAQPSYTWTKVNLGDYMTISYQTNNRFCWGWGAPGPQYGSLNMNS